MEFKRRYATAYLAKNDPLPGRPGTIDEVLADPTCQRNMFAVLLAAAIVAWSPGPTLREQMLSAVARNVFVKREMFAQWAANGYRRS